MDLKAVFTNPAALDYAEVRDMIVVTHVPTTGVSCFTSTSEIWISVTCASCKQNWPCQLVQALKAYVNDGVALEYPASWRLDPHTSPVVES